MMMIVMMIGMMILRILFNKLKDLCIGSDNDRIKQISYVFTVNYQ